MKFFGDPRTNIPSLFFVFLSWVAGSLNFATAQVTFDWNAGATSGQWSVAGNWTGVTPGGNEILQFGNNAQASMTNDLVSTNRYKITFLPGATIARNVSGVAANTFYEFGATWPRIQNDANVLHTLAFPINASTNPGYNLELVANAGALSFTNSINNNARTIQIYGNNSAVDGTDRYIRLSGILSNAGGLNISQFGVAKLNAANTYTGQTQIDNGELWIESAGSIAAGSGIFLGNGSQLTNVAKLWLSNAAGGTTFPNNLTVHNGNANTRHLGGLNTSGTNTFSGDITNNSTTGGLNLSALTAGGTTNFSGIISGSSGVTTEGAGTLIFSGTGANTYTGATTANGVLLVLNKSADTKAVGGPLIISNGATVRTDAQNQLGTGTPAFVTINGTGVFNCNGFNQNIALASTSGAALVSMGTGTLSIDNTGTDTYAGTISGSGGITKTNTGIQILSGTGNSYFGNTTVTGGTLQLGAAGVIPDASPLVLNGGIFRTGAAAGFSETMATLNLNANSTIALGTGNHTITFSNSSGVSWAGSQLVITGWAGTYGGGTTGTAGKIFVGSSAAGLASLQLSKIQFFNGTNYYLASQLSTGEVIPTAAIGLYWGGTAAQSWLSSTWSTIDGGPYSASWTNNYAAVFNVVNSTISGATTNFSSIRANENVVFTASNTLGTGGTIAPIDVAAGKTFDLGAQPISIAAGTGLIKNGSGTLISANGNAYLGGFTLNDGLMVVGGLNAMGNGGPLNINGGTLGTTVPRNIANRYTGINVGGDFTIGATGYSGSFTFADNVALGNSTTRIITLGAAATQTFNGVISGTGSSLMLNATAAGTLSMGGANSYGGSTTINGGTLQLGLVNSLPATTAVLLANTGGATLSLAGFNQTVASLAGGGSAGGNINLGSASLSFGNAANTTYSGSISGTGGLVKQGTGVFTLGHTANSFTGATTISNGEFRLNPAASIATFASQIILDGGKLSTVNIAAATTFTSSSTLNLSASGSIDLGATAHSLSFADCSAVSWNGAASLVINGWTGTAGTSGTTGKLFCGATNASLTPGQLAQISFNGFPGVAMLLATGELVPSPAVNYTWTGNSDGLWTTATNWTPNGIPTAADNIIINSPGTFTLTLSSSRSVNDVTLGGTGTLTLLSSSVLNVYGSFTNTSIAAFPLNADCASIVNFAGGNIQTIPALNYGSLNLTGGNRILASSGTIGICGTYTPGAGTTTITGSTISFNGSGVQVMPVTHNYASLTIANTSGGFVAPGGSLVVGTALTVNNGSRLDIGSNTLTLTGSTSIISGILRSSGIVTQASGTLTFGATGVYEHNYANSVGQIPAATYNSASTVRVIGYNANTFTGGLTAAAGFAQTFGNFEWNCPGQTGTINWLMDAATPVIAGNFLLVSTGTAPNGLRIANNPVTFQINGDFLQSGGILDFSNAAVVINMNIGRNFSQTGGTISKSIGGTTATINFNGTVNQTINIPIPGNIPNAINFRVNNFAGITIANGSTLPINANAVFFRANGAITLTGTGNINYAPSAILTYDPSAAVALTTSNAEWPSTGVNHVVINSTSSNAVTLHAGRDLPSSPAGTITFTTGRLALGAFSLTVQNNATNAVASAGGFAETNGAGALIRTILSSNNNVYLFPVGNGTKYTPASFNFATNSVAGRQLAVRAVSGTHPQMNNPAAPVHYIANRYWTTSLNDGTGTYLYTPTYTYSTAAPNDVTGAIGSIRLSRWTGSVWSNITNSNASGADLTTGAGLSQITGSLDAAQWTGREIKIPETYTWSLGANGAWTVAGNWTPNGIPTTGDIVQFTHNGSYDITNVPTSITLAKMIFGGGGTTTFFVANSGSVNIGGGTNPALSISSGTTMIISGNSASDWTILTGGTGSVFGNIRLRGVSSNTAHTLQAEDAGALVFGIGSYFAEGVLNTSNYSGNPFGSIGNANTVVFQSGSTFEQFDGGNPFALSQPSSKVLFNSGSLYKYSDNNTNILAVPSFSGRIFANFEYNSNQNKSVTGGSAFSMDDLTITQGTFNLNLDAAGSSIKGSISVGAGTALACTPATAASINLNGTGAPQIISGTGTMTVGANTTLNVTNTTGVFLQKNLANPGTITVASGALLSIINENVVSGPGVFTLQSGGTLGIGSASGINSAGATGNIQTGTRSYSSLANYTYRGTANQVTGNFTTTPTANSVSILTISNTGTSPTNITTLTNNTTSATLNLASGRFAAGTGQTLRIAAGGTVNGSGFSVYTGDQYIADAAGGTIEFTGNGAVRGTPTLYNVTIGNSGGGVDFTNNATIYNNLQINNQGSINPGAPKYATGSTLIYNTGGTYNRSIEWGQATAVEAGYPHHVLVQNGTMLNLGNAVPPALEIGGNLTIGTASSGSNIVNMNALTIPLKVLGNLVIGNPLSSGSRLYLSSVSGGDLELSGDFTRHLTTNYFDYGTRAVFFKGATNTSITATAQNFYKILMEKTGAGDLTLNCPVLIENTADFATGKINTTATNLLTFDVGAVVAGTPGVASYINGPVAKRYTSAGAEFEFPVGKSTATPAYNPCGILPVSIGSLTTFTAEYLKDPHQAQGIMGANLLGIINPGYWNISNSLPGTSTAMVKLYYTPPGNGNWVYYNGSASSPYSIAAMDPCAGCNVAVVHRNSSTTTWAFTSTSGMFNSSWPEFRYSSNPGFIYSTVQSSFSPFSIGYAYNIILPLKLLSFQGKLDNGKGLLSWEIYGQRDAGGFELQHSRDGRQFFTVAKIPVEGSLNQYRYTHKELAEGVHYYRLLIREKQGGTFYSQVVMLNAGRLFTRILGPVSNPSRNAFSFNIVSAANQRVAAVITDAAGRVCGRYEGGLHPGLNQWTVVGTAQLLSGLYFVRLVTSDNQQEAFTLWKQ